ncbi:hypothetical protein NP493_179g00029 [Ridgeia piscesae]|uniref:Uncharacterized protein n=1 Tax=Ridgeia piscesae TaxID=27915 RepID=A0AAD9P2R2_RIDPI|nr:hypothetical protein NP493_179g00029 [Ridgeia piscesae]
MPCVTIDIIRMSSTLHSTLVSRQSGYLTGMEASAPPVLGSLSRCNTQYNWDHFTWSTFEYLPGSWLYSLFRKYNCPV